ncbi:MAG: TolC family protein [Desulfonatronovibrio sp.]
MYRIFFMFFLLLVVLVYPAAAGDTDNAPVQKFSLTLEEAVKLGLEKNPRVKAEEYGIMKSESELKSARGGFFPRASAGAGYTHLKSTYASGHTDADYMDQEQYHWNLRLAQTVFAGMTIYNSYQKARIQKEISELEKETTERELIGEIQYYFLNLLKAREDQKSIENTIERLEVGLEAASAFYKVHMAPYVEVLQAEVELEEARQDLSRADNQVKVQKTRLNSLLGFSHDHQVEYTGDLSDIAGTRPHSPQETLEIALEKRTDLEFIRKNMEAARKEMSISKGRMLPKVDLELTYFDRIRDYEEKGVSALGQEVDRDQTNQYWTAGINIQWNFFSGGQDHYRAQGMDHEISRLEQLLKDSADNIIAEVRTALLRLDEARQRFGSTRKAIAAAKENYAMQEHRFKKRVGTVQELLTAQEHLARAEANRNQALLDYQLALSELYFAMGERNYGLD